MVKYVCIYCGYVVDYKDLKTEIRCPKCGRKIFLKLEEHERELLAR